MLTFWETTFVKRTVVIDIWSSQSMTSDIIILPAGVSHWFSCRLSWHTAATYAILPENPPFTQYSLCVGKRSTGSPPPLYASFRQQIHLSRRSLALNDLTSRSLPFMPRLAYSRKKTSGSSGRITAGSYLAGSRDDTSGRAPRTRRCPPGGRWPRQWGGTRPTTRGSTRSGRPSPAPGTLSGPRTCPARSTRPSSSRTLPGRTTAKEVVHSTGLFGQGSQVDSIEP